MVQVPNKHMSHLTFTVIATIFLAFCPVQIAGSASTTENSSTSSVASDPLFAECPLAKQFLRRSLKDVLCPLPCTHWHAGANAGKCVRKWQYRWVWNTAEKKGEYQKPDGTKEEELPKYDKDYADQCKKTGSSTKEECVGENGDSENCEWRPGTRHVAIYMPPHIGDICAKKEKRPEVHCFPPYGIGPGSSYAGNEDPAKEDYMVCQQRFADKDGNDGTEENSPVNLEENREMQAGKYEIKLEGNKTVSVDSSNWGICAQIVALPYRRDIVDKYGMKTYSQASRETTLGQRSGDPTIHGWRRAEGVRSYATGGGRDHQPTTDQLRPKFKTRSRYKRLGYSKDSQTEAASSSTRALSHSPRGTYMRNFEKTRGLFECCLFALGGDTNFKGGEGKQWKNGGSPIKFQYRASYRYCYVYDETVMRGNFARDSWQDMETGVSLRDSPAYGYPRDPDVWTMYWRDASGGADGVNLKLPGTGVCEVSNGFKTIGDGYYHALTAPVITDLFKPRGSVFDTDNNSQYVNDFMNNYRLEQPQVCTRPMTGQCEEIIRYKNIASAEGCCEACVHKPMLSYYKGDQKNADKLRKKAINGAFENPCVAWQIVNGYCVIVRKKTIKKKYWKENIDNEVANRISVAQIFDPAQNGLVSKNDALPTPAYGNPGYSAECGKSDGSNQSSCNKRSALRYREFDGSFEGNVQFPVRPPTESIDYWKRVQKKKNDFLGKEGDGNGVADGSVTRKVEKRESLTEIDKRILNTQGAQITSQAGKYGQIMKSRKSLSEFKNKLSESTLDNVNLKISADLLRANAQASVSEHITQIYKNANTPSLPESQRNFPPPKITSAVRPAYLVGSCARIRVYTNLDLEDISHQAGVDSAGTAVVKKVDRLRAEAYPVFASPCVTVIYASMVQNGEVTVQAAKATKVSVEVPLKLLMDKAMKLWESDKVKYGNNQPTESSVYPVFSFDSDGSGKNDIIFSNLQSKLIKADSTTKWANTYADDIKEVNPIETQKEMLRLGTIDIPEEVVQTQSSSTSTIVVVTQTAAPTTTPAPSEKCKHDGDPEKPEYTATDRDACWYIFLAEYTLGKVKVSSFDDLKNKFAWRTNRQDRSALSYWEATKVYGAWTAIGSTDSSSENSSSSNNSNSNNNADAGYEDDEEKEKSTWGKFFSAAADFAGGLFDKVQDVVDDAFDLVQKMTEQIFDKVSDTRKQTISFFGSLMDDVNVSEAKIEKLQDLGYSLYKMVSDFDLESIGNAFFNQLRKLDKTKARVKTYVTTYVNGKPTNRTVEATENDEDLKQKLSKSYEKTLNFAVANDRIKVNVRIVKRPYYYGIGFTATDSETGNIYRGAVGKYLWLEGENVPTWRAWRFRFYNCIKEGEKLETKWQRPTTTTSSSRRELSHASSINTGGWTLGTTERKENNPNAKSANFGYMSLSDCMLKCELMDGKKNKGKCVGQGNWVYKPCETGGSCRNTTSSDGWEEKCGNAESKNACDNVSTNNCKWYSSNKNENECEAVNVKALAKNQASPGCKWVGVKRNWIASEVCAPGADMDSDKGKLCLATSAQVNKESCDKVKTDKGWTTATDACIWGKDSRDSVEKYVPDTAGRVCNSVHMSGFSRRFRYGGQECYMYWSDLRPYDAVNPNSEQSKKPGWLPYNGVQILTNAGDADGKCVNPNLKPDGLYRTLLYDYRAYSINRDNLKTQTSYGSLYVAGSVTKTEKECDSGNCRRLEEKLEVEEQHRRLEIDIEVAEREGKADRPEIHGARRQLEEVGKVHRELQASDNGTDPAWGDLSALERWKLFHMDSDNCLKASANWAGYTCKTGKEKGFCDTYKKDMHRCCPLSCALNKNEPPLTWSRCNALSGSGAKGDCTYPNFHTKLWNCGLDDDECLALTSGEGYWNNFPTENVNSTCANAAKAVLNGYEPYSIDVFLCCPASARKELDRKSKEDNGNALPIEGMTLVAKPGVNNVAASTKETYLKDNVNVTKEGLFIDLHDGLSYEDCEKMRLAGYTFANGGENFCAGSYPHRQMRFCVDTVDKGSYQALINDVEAVMSIKVDIERMAREKVEDFQNYYQEKVAGANDFASEQADALHEAASEGWTQVTDTGSSVYGNIMEGYEDAKEALSEVTDFLGEGIVKIHDVVNEKGEMTELYADKVRDEIVDQTGAACDELGTRLVAGRNATGAWVDSVGGHIADSTDYYIANTEKFGGEIMNKTGHVVKHVEGKTAIAVASTKFKLFDGIVAYKNRLTEYAKKGYAFANKTYNTINEELKDVYGDAFKVWNGNFGDNQVQFIGNIKSLEVDDESVANQPFLTEEEESIQLEEGASFELFTPKELQRVTQQEALLTAATEKVKQIENQFETGAITETQKIALLAQEKVEVDCKTSAIHMCEGTNKTLSLGATELVAQRQSVALFMKTEKTGLSESVVTASAVEKLSAKALTAKDTDPVPTKAQVEVALKQQALEKEKKKEVKTEKEVKLAVFPQMIVDIEAFVGQTLLGTDSKGAVWGLLGGLLLIIHILLILACYCCCCRKKLDEDKAKAAAELLQGKIPESDEDAMKKMMLATSTLSDMKKGPGDDRGSFQAWQEGGEMAYDEYKKDNPNAENDINKDVVKVIPNDDELNFSSPVPGTVNDDDRRISKEPVAEKKEEKKDDDSKPTSPKSRASSKSSNSSSSSSSSGSSKSS